MIRKISHISLILVLFFLTIGFTVSKHYCGGELVDVSVLTGNAAGCSDDDGGCEMGGCCHNESHVFQLHEDYTSPFIVDHVACFQVELATLTLDLLNLQPGDVESSAFNRIEAPPPLPVSTSLAIIQVYRL